MKSIIKTILDVLGGNRILMPTNGTSQVTFWRGVDNITQNNALNTTLIDVEQF